MREEGALVSWQDLGDTGGLRELAGEAREGLVRGEADGERQADLSTDLFTDPRRGFEGVARETSRPRQVDEEVIDGRDLDCGGVAQEDPGGLLAQAIRGLGVAATKDGVRTEAGGLGETHAGSDAIGAGSIGGGHDEVALVRHASDHERLAAELGVQHLLD